MTAARKSRWTVGTIPFALLAVMGGCPAPSDGNGAATGDQAGAGSDVAGSQTEKNRAPIPDAGVDQVVSPGDLVVLNGTRTKDEDGDQLLFIWQQVEGDAKVEIAGTFSSIARFDAPQVAAETPLKFRLIAVDGSHAAVDEVVVTIAPPQ